MQSGTGKRGDRSLHQGLSICLQAIGRGGEAGGEHRHAEGTPGAGSRAGGVRGRTHSVCGAVEQSVGSPGRSPAKERRREQNTHPVQRERQGREARQGRGLKNTETKVTLRFVFKKHRATVLMRIALTFKKPAAQITINIP